MRRVLVCSVLSLALAFGVGINSASATLFLSGDNNIVNPLNAGNRYGEPIDTGNQQFFTAVMISKFVIKTNNMKKVN